MNVAPASDVACVQTPCRRVSWILAILLAVKIGVSVWNAAAYNSDRQYDARYHHNRLKTCGLETSAYFYNPPGYYLFGCPFLVHGYVDRFENFLSEFVLPKLHGEPDPGLAYQRRHGVDVSTAINEMIWSRVMPAMRWVNVLMLTAFYGIWLFVLFPRLLPRPRETLLAGVLLLALPGYQKLTVMVHPDNLLVLMTTVLFFVWTAMNASERLTGRLSASSIAGIGVTGLTRPLSIWPVAFFSLLAAREMWLKSPPFGEWRPSAVKVRRFLVLSLMITVICGSWWGYRYAVSDAILRSDPVDEGRQYMDKYRERVADFDYVHFYTNFPLKPFFRIPNRHFGPLHGGSPSWQNSNNNSFPILFLSELWGDHWLYFSGERDADVKVVFKRIAFAIAFPATAFGAGLFLFRLVGLVRRKEPTQIERWLLVAGLFGLGGMIPFMLWQGTIGLEPGKNAGIKFIYFANVIPFFLPVIAHGAVMTRRLYMPLLAGAGLLFAAALPLAVFWR